MNKSKNNTNGLIDNILDVSELIYKDSSPSTNKKPVTPKKRKASLKDKMFKHIRNSISIKSPTSMIDTIVSMHRAGESPNHIAQHVDLCLDLILDIIDTVNLESGDKSVKS